MLHRTLPNPGDTLAGKYQLVKKLGEGGMGVVYEAVHTRIHQRVAIKMLLPEVLDLPEVVPRFEREARAAGKLRSDNTARVLDVDMSENGLPYMVMEFLDGTDLGQMLEKNGALPIHEAVDYVLQACNAMAEAHSEGVIHRDLKPSNLFVTVGRKLKVLDFGISKLENDQEARVTATQAVVGTPLYMSPEQVRSAKHVDARSDIWSLGIILYELVTGRTPFEGSTTAAAAAICIDEPPPIAAFRQGVPPDLERAIMVALQKEPSNRFANVQLLAQAIAPFGSGAIAAPDTAPAPFPVPSNSNTRLPSIPSRPELGSAPTMHSDPGASGPRAANPHTLPGWTTRSSPGKRRSKTIITVVLTIVGMLAIAGVIGLVANLTKHKEPEPAATGEHATATATTTTTTATTTATATETATATGPVSTSGSSSTAIPSTRPTNTRPRPTATATVTSPPTATHTTAPAPTRL